MEAPHRVEAILNDARVMEAAAIERLNANDIRDAAEKAWIATKRAADALILARTGHEPRSSGQIGRGVRLLRRDDAFASLYTNYFARQAELHGNCAYDGNCEPVEAIAIQIHETRDFIDQCQQWAEAS